MSPLSVIAKHRMHELVRHRDPHFSLAICGLYHPDSHGNLAYEFDRVRDYVYGSYLCYTSEVEERSESLTTQTFIEEEKLWQDCWEDNVLPEPSHPLIRTSGHGKPRLEIVRVVRLISDQDVCIIKTFWIKLLQRKWKSYYRRLLARRRNPKALLHRSIWGRWP